MEENKQETVSSNEENKNTQTRAPYKKTVWDFNFSWFLLIALGGGCVGLASGNLSYALQAADLSNNILYVLLTVVISLVVGIVFYSIGRIAFGYLSGYRLSSLTLFGVRFARVDKKWQISSPKGILGVFDFRLLMAPKSEKSKPTIMLLGGLFGSVILQAIVVLVAMLASKNELIQVSVLFSIGYIAFVLIYQLLPVKLDTYNDGFWLLKTRNPEDTLAYNLYLTNINIGYTYGPLEVEDMESYSSYAKANYAYYVYLNHLYKDELEKCIPILNELAYYSTYLSFEYAVKVKGERLYLLVIGGEEEKADKLFRSYSKEEQSEMVKFRTLSECRISMLINGVISSEFHNCYRIIKEYDELLKKIESNERVEKEKELFEITLNKVKSVHPNWDFSNPNPVVEDDEVEVASPTESIKKSIADEDEDEDEEE